MPITFADIAPRDPTEEMIDRAFPMLMGFRAGKEPDASWHRPSWHKPGEAGKEVEEERKAEEERQERCERHERVHNGIIEEYKNNPDKLEEANEMIKALNNHFVPYGCPSLPEIEPETSIPAFALNNGLVNPKRPASLITDIIFPLGQR